jgi:hypothetical protein
MSIKMKINMELTRTRKQTWSRTQALSRHRARNGNGNGLQRFAYLILDMGKKFNSISDTMSDKVLPTADTGGSDTGGSDTGGSDTGGSDTRFNPISFITDIGLYILSLT